MHTENANSQNAFDLVQSQDFIANVAAILMPAISDAVNDAVNKAVTLATSPTILSRTLLQPTASACLCWRNGLLMALSCLPLLHLSPTRRTALIVRPAKW